MSSTLINAVNVNAAAICADAAASHDQAKPAQQNYNTRSKAKTTTTPAAAAAIPAPASKNNNKKNKAQQKKEKTTAYNMLSSSEEDDDDDDDEDCEMDEDCITTSEDEDEDEETETADDKLAMKEYRKFLCELFPSKYMAEKVAATPSTLFINAKNANNETANKKRKATQNSICPGAPRKAPTRYVVSAFMPNKKKRTTEVEAETEESESISETEDDDDEDEDDAVENFPLKKGAASNFNISFIIDGSSMGMGGGGGGDNMSFKEMLYDEEYDDEEYDDDVCEECELSECECEDEDEDENATTSEEEEEEEVQPRRSKRGTVIKPRVLPFSLNTRKSAHAGSGATGSGATGSGANASASASVSAVAEAAAGTAVSDDAAFTKLKELFAGLTPAEQTHPIMKDVIKKIKTSEEQYTRKRERESRKEKTKNTKKFKSLLKEKDVMNDLKYFHEKMTVEEQKTALAQIEIIKQHSDITKPYRLSLLEADIPPQYKACAYRKMSTLRFMEPGGSEYYKMKNWVDAFMRIPFGKYRNLPISMEDGVDKCHDFITNAKQILDDAVYGLNDAKLQIMQMIGQWIVNPTAIGTAIAIKGPMGTGKTTLVKDGISKILGRDFAFIALGGATDSSFLEGHSYTYEGSSWGKIVELLIKCKSMNPVIYFDELDKISDTPKGDEIVGILTHLTDTSQNNQFHDRYFSELDFDLSRCLFIFSYNDESKVNRILLDRMYRIQTKGYDLAQKTKISNNYLLPKIREQVMFKDGDITIPEDTLHHIINNHTEKEDGVRTLKRCLEIVHTKLNLYRLMKPNTNVFENDMEIKVEFPFKLTPGIVDKLIKNDAENGSGWKNMYM
jgi:hypothetical protein